jgi:hypothetical protein
MRIPRWAGLLVVAVLAFWLGRGSTGLSAQSLLPDGVFVRDSGGGVWLIIGGQRAQVPFFPAADDVIASVPDSGQWVVQGDGGTLTLGGQPDYVFAAPVVMQAPPPPEQPTATPTPVPEDPPPTVSIQVDDANIQIGQTVSVTVIAQDNGPIDYIQWEGTIQESDDNDNKATGDEDLDAEHRHDCDGQTQCAFVWQISPKVNGRFVLRARGKDQAGSRSAWTSIEFRVRGSAATATPTPGASGPPPAVSSPTP